MGFVINHDFITRRERLAWIHVVRDHDLSCPRHLP